MAANAWKNVVGVTQGLLRWLKKPWEITGPVASPEFKDSVLDALEYREFSPATPAQRAYIPHANPDRVYDIKYFTRDGRRAPYERKVVFVDPRNYPEIENLPPSPIYYKLGERVPLDDTPGDGYQK